jgi:hypothetical protein
MLRGIVASGLFKRCFIVLVIGAWPVTGIRATAARSVVTFATQPWNYASACLFVANTILLRHLFAWNINRPMCAWFLVEPRSAAFIA